MPDGIYEYAIKNFRKHLGLKKPKTLFVNATNFSLDTKDFDISLFNKEDKFCLLESSGDEYCPKRELDYEPNAVTTLFFDANGQVLDFKVDIMTDSMFDAIKDTVFKVKEKYKAHKVYYLADDISCFRRNYEDIIKEGFGVLTPCDPRDLTDDLLTSLFASDGWMTLEPDNESYLIQDCSAEIYDKTFRYKVCDLNEWTIEEAFNLFQSGVNNENCKLIFAFSENRRQMDLNLLMSDIFKAKELIEADAVLDYKNSLQSDILYSMRIFTGVPIEEALRARVYRLNSQGIEKRQRLCGYSVLFLKKAQVEDDNFDYLEVLKAYYHLEPTKKYLCSMKPYFSLGSAHVRDVLSMRAHLFLSMLSLMMLKVVQANLIKTGCPLTLKQIIDALRTCYLSPFSYDNKMYYMHTATFNNALLPTSLNLASIFGDDGAKAQDNNKATLTERDGLVKENALQTADYVNKILKACNLEPLAVINTDETLKARFKVSTREKSLIDKVLKEYLSKVFVADNLLDKKERSLFSPLF